MDNRKSPPPPPEATSRESNGKSNDCVVQHPASKRKCQNGGGQPTKEARAEAPNLSASVFGSKKLTTKESSVIDDEEEEEESPLGRNTSSLFDTAKANEYNLASRRLHDDHAYSLCSSGKDGSSSSDNYDDEEHYGMEHLDEEGSSDSGDEDDNSIVRTLKVRSRRHYNPSTVKATKLITIDLSNDWPTAAGNDDGGGAAVAKRASSGANGGGSGYDSDELLGRERMATAAVGTLFREMGVVILKSAERPTVCDDGSDDSAVVVTTNSSPSDTLPKSPTETLPKVRPPNSPTPCHKEAKNDSGDSVVVMDDDVDDDDEDDEEVVMLFARRSPRRPVYVVPPDLLDELVSKAKLIENEVCSRLDEVGRIWRAKTESDCNDRANKTSPLDEENQKMPSRETAAQEEEAQKRRQKQEADSTFRYYEVASRCPGRLDVRWKMDEPPFNDPRVVSNPILLPVIRDLLGGPTGGATLLYAGLIFSFPHSSDQPWHMDGAALFPEEREWLDLPPYALNVFIPLDDVTDDLGPTEFLPASHLASRASQIDDDLLQWAVHESKAASSGSGGTQRIKKKQRSSSFSEEVWMNRHSVIAPRLRCGDALIYDYRVCHRGTRNLDDTKTRTMLYLMYARPWFKEHLNFGDERLFRTNASREKKRKTMEADI